MFQVTVIYACVCVWKREGGGGGGGGIVHCWNGGTDRNYNMRRINEFSRIISIYVLFNSFEYFLQFKAFFQRQVNVRCFDKEENQR